MKAEIDYLYFTSDTQALTVEVLKFFNESYCGQGVGGINIPCRGIRILGWAHFENGKRLPHPLPFTTLLKGTHAIEFTNGIRTLQFRG